MKRNRVIINNIIPEDSRILFPASPTLKNVLHYNNFVPVIAYWNLKLLQLQSSFIWDANALDDDNESSLLLFLNYLAVKENDKKAYFNIKAKLMGIKPNHTTSEIAFFDKHVQLYAQKLDEVVEAYLKEIYSDDTLCFVFQVDSKYKWICASIIAEKVKQLYAESTIIISGIDCKDVAVSYLQQFSQFDFAIWGEAEQTILDLCNCLAGECKAFEGFPCLAFRRNDDVICSTNNKEFKIPFTGQVLRPDYTDYFEQKQTLEAAVAGHLPVISIETSRKHRFKPAQVIADEIEYFINKYQIYAFRFSNFEAIGNERTVFNRLLDMLIRIKEKYPDFSVSLMPIRADAIDSAAIRKMMMAGFFSILTDYISPSENLLKKYGAKSAFADYLLLMKFAFQYHIIMAEMNTITGIPGEADENIVQAISNLYYLRFFFKGGIYSPRMKKAEISYPSKLYKKAKRNKNNWDINPLLKRFLPSSYLSSDAKGVKFIPLTPVQVNPLWEDFKQTVSYFTQNVFEYKLYRRSENAVLYKELFNNHVINEFELDATDWFILETANSQVIHIEHLLDKIKKNIKSRFLDIEIINILENLKTERLIYISDDYLKIVSIINTELII